MCIRDRDIVNPAIRDGKISGRITRNIVCLLFAPRIFAASSYWISIFSKTGCTARTTNGIPINTSATMIPSLVYAILIPNF